MSKPPCGTCRYWELLKNLRDMPEGRCRILPPVMVVDRGVTTNVRGTWPLTSMDDWCGAHKPEVVWASNESMNLAMSEKVERLTRRPKP